MSFWLCGWFSLKNESRRTLYWDFIQTLHWFIVGFENFVLWHHYFPSTTALLWPSIIVFLFLSLTLGFSLHQNNTISLQWLDIQFSSLQRSVISDSATQWTAAHQATLPISNSWSLFKLMSIESVMPSNYFIFFLSPSPPAFNHSQHQGPFKWVSSSHQVAKVLEFQL